MWKYLKIPWQVDCTFSQLTHRKEKTRHHKRKKRGRREKKIDWSPFSNDLGISHACDIISQCSYDLKRFLSFSPNLSTAVNIFTSLAIVSLNFATDSKCLDPVSLLWHMGRFFFLFSSILFSSHMKIFFRISKTPLAHQQINATAIKQNVGTAPYQLLCRLLSTFVSSR